MSIIALVMIGFGFLCMIIGVLLLSNVGLRKQELELGIYWDGTMHRKIATDEPAGYYAYEDLKVKGLL